MADPRAVRVEGDRKVLDFGQLDLPRGRWYFRIPAWMGAPFYRAVRLRPRVVASRCVGCGRCVEVCPQDAIEAGKPPHFDLDRCIGCLCCGEVCPEGAIEPHRGILARLIGIGY